MHSKPDNSVSFRSVANPCYTTQPELKNDRPFFPVFHPDHPFQSVMAIAPTQISKRFTTHSWLLARFELLWLLAFCDGFLSHLEGF
jgi:hypothetical protein